MIAPFAYADPNCRPTASPAFDLHTAMESLASEKDSATSEREPTRDRLMPGPGQGPGERRKPKTRRASGALGWPIHAAVQELGATSDVIVPGLENQKQESSRNRSQRFGVRHLVAVALVRQGHNRTHNGTSEELKDEVSPSSFGAPAVPMKGEPPLRVCRIPDDERIIHHHALRREPGRCYAATVTWQALGASVKVLCSLGARNIHQLLQSVGRPACPGCVPIGR